MKIETKTITFNHVENQYFTSTCLISNPVIDFITSKSKIEVAQSLAALSDDEILTQHYYLVYNFCMEKKKSVLVNEYCHLSVKNKNSQANSTDLHRLNDLVKKHPWLNLYELTAVNTNKKYPEFEYDAYSDELFHVLMDKFSPNKYQLTMVYNNKEFDTDNKSIASIASTLLGLNDGETINWRLASNKVEKVSKLELQSIYNQALHMKSACLESFDSNQLRDIIKKIQMFEQSSIRYVPQE